ncbi:hypothetical protein NL355_30395, partial [Klebsiella pneumoniae]|nr:hypothetical protein [Klebsiella pneumoniae]
NIVSFIYVRARALTGSLFLTTDIFLFSIKPVGSLFQRSAINVIIRCLYKKRYRLAGALRILRGGFHRKENY